VPRNSAHRRPAIDSVAYATDLNEVKALGGAVSATRTPAQLETARFHSEAPAIFLTGNFGKFARTTADVADAARLMAIDLRRLCRCNRGLCRGQVFL
jgi:Zn-dependent alcohol dehydrogenase